MEKGEDQARDRLSLGLATEGAIGKIPSCGCPLSRFFAPVTSAMGWLKNKSSCGTASVTAARFGS